MRPPTRFLTVFVTAALLTTQFPLGGRALKAAQAPELNQIPDLAQSPGFLGTSEPLPLVAISETGDLDPLTEAGPQMEPLPL
jgi:hypothetical protein